MAATRIMSIHINKGKTARQCIGERLDYIMNPKKTDGGILVSTYACSPETAADEFMLFRQEYQANTGRTQENEVIGYHVRQAFKPEEITPEVANEIGNELASRMTDDQFAYVVATHIDKHHIHNHIILCSTDLEGQHKYRDVKQSAKDLAQISDSLCREHGLGLVLAVGGGSVIDSAKAIALGVPHEGDVWELYLSKKQPQSDPLPVATVLTIPAAGSESSPNTVITNEETRRKLGYGSPKLRPVFSIINPELFFTLPHRQMANGISDMMSHIFERYFTKTLHTDLSDSLCEATLRTIMKNARILNGNLNDYNAWAEIAFSGNIAHNNLLGVGREQDWGCHAMEHELSALYHVDHGAGLAVVTPAWMKYVSPKHQEIFVQFAVNVMGVEGSFREPSAIIREGISRLERFYRELGLPTTMEELNILPGDFPLMAEQAVSVRGPVGGLEKLDVRDIQAIYRLGCSNLQHA